MVRAKIDFRRIKQSRSYTVPEVAVLLRVATGTVRRWVREGLPSLDTQRPKLVHGSQLKAWIRKQAATHKRKCGERQIYCCKCREPRESLPGSILIIQRNPKSATVKALCIACGTMMNRHCSAENAADWASGARPMQGHQLRLIASANPLVNDAFVAPSHGKAG